MKRHVKNDMMTNVPRHRIYHDDEIYVCLACEKRYTIEMIDIHTDKCSKMDEYHKSKQSEQLLLDI